MLLLQPQSKDESYQSAAPDAMEANPEARVYA